MVTVAYIATAELSLQLALVGESVTPLWPPTGIALASLLLLGVRVWPAIAAAAFLVNLPLAPGAPAAVAIAAGNTLAPLLAVWLLRRTGFRTQLDRTRDAIALVFLGALAAMTVSATVGTVALLLSDSVDAAGFWPAWSVWWAGDATGVLAVAPFLFSLATPGTYRRLSIVRGLEIVAIFAAITVITIMIARTGSPLWSAVFPVLGWSAWRFRQQVAAPAAMVAIVAATLIAARDLGPLAHAPLLEKMLTLQIYNVSVAFTSFFFAAVVEDRRRIAEAERETQTALYRREHRIAEGLQRSLLPDRLPGTPDLLVATRYIPATGDVEVGGDWYDVVSLADGRFGLAIGDVAGHGVAAAAAMGQMRMALRAYALEGLRPSGILARLSALLQEFQPGAMATLLYIEIDPDTGSIVSAKAGHPPAWRASIDGSVVQLPGPVAPPLGASPQVTYVDAVDQVEDGATLYLYTDGLIERRGESFDRGLERLRDAIASAPADLEEACDAIIERLIGPEPSGDDTALLAVRRLSFAGRPLHLHLPALPTRLAPTRRIVARWLRQNAIADGDAAEILLACGEACSNAMQHAYGSADGWFELDVALDGDEVELRVRDSGRWKHPIVGDPVESGRGISLMRGLMDQVDVVHRAQGTEVWMRRRAGSAVGDG